MRILALVPGGIGDQILFFPTLEDLKTQYPNATIDVIVESRAKSAYRVCPCIHEVLIFDYQAHSGLADYLNVLGIIRDREYDIALNLGQKWTIDLLLWLNGIPLRIGYRSQTSWFVSNPVPLKTEQYASHVAHDLLTGLGIKSSCPPLKIAVPTEDIDWAQAEQQRLDLKDNYVLIYNGSSRVPQESKAIYPVEQWRTIIDSFKQKQPNLSVVLLQDSNNSEQTILMQENYPMLKVTRPGDVGKLAAIIAGANSILCTDSDPLQLAVAVGTYTFALFGPTDSTKLLPSGSERYIGIQSSTDKVADIPPETIMVKMWGS
ncbi:glycosyl transferase [cyanobacterium endosymbiont of Rhopalodia gibberula]|uniref:glycosyltransferase family 9 protein n=1 Tax=cyanobacterium endosymbiont of Rhopalodia gibberula TaxID=1763363 RepID=UPI000DC73758|nr:glycosyltransferase family 9 protein [cyanobacterium endosymbiont of Rhopalodia gibberula]BBA79803.1 glycosyl transferase [cyanobacterium endosymbiont of Rhopalodia gibberula]